MRKGGGGQSPTALFLLYTSLPSEAHFSLFSMFEFDLDAFEIYGHCVREALTARPHLNGSISYLTRNVAI